MRLDTIEKIQKEFDDGTLSYRGEKVLDLTFRQNLFEYGVLFINSKGWITIYSDAMKQGLFKSTKQYNIVCT